MGGVPISNNHQTYSLIIVILNKVTWWWKRYSGFVILHNNLQITTDGFTHNASFWYPAARQCLSWIHPVFTNFCNSFAFWTNSNAALPWSRLLSSIAFWTNSEARLRGSFLGESFFGARFLFKVPLIKCCCQNSCTTQWCSTINRIQSWRPPYPLEVALSTPEVQVDHHGGVAASVHERHPWNLRYLKASNLRSEIASWDIDAAMPY